jgi:propanediol dehydratase small subunit
VCFLTGAAVLALSPVAGEGVLQDKPQPPVVPAPPLGAQSGSADLQVAQQNPSAVKAERQKQIADESAGLLKLATDLKTEVDKTTKDTLSLKVIRKAGEVERMARTMRESAKLPAGAN